MTGETFAATVCRRDAAYNPTGMYSRRIAKNVPRAYYTSHAQAFLPSCNPCNTRPDCLQYQIRIYFLNKGIELFHRTRQLYRVSAFRNIDDTATEYIRQMPDLIPRLYSDPDLHQHQFAFDMSAFGQIKQFDHIHQFVQLLGDLLDNVIRTGCDQRHA